LLCACVGRRFQGRRNDQADHEGGPCDRVHTDSFGSADSTSSLIGARCELPEAAEDAESAEETDSHRETKKRRTNGGGSTGVAKRRALPDRTRNTSAIPVRGDRVFGPIQQRHVG